VTLGLRRSRGLRIQHICTEAQSLWPRPMFDKIEPGIHKVIAQRARLCTQQRAVLRVNLPVIERFSTTDRARGRGRKLREVTELPLRAGACSTSKFAWSKLNDWRELLDAVKIHFVIRFLGSRRLTIHCSLVSCVSICSEIPALRRPAPASARQRLDRSEPTYFFLISNRLSIVVR